MRPGTGLNSGKYIESKIIIRTYKLPVSMEQYIKLHIIIVTDQFTFFPFGSKSFPFGRMQCGGRFRQFSVEKKLHFQGGVSKDRVSYLKFFDKKASLSREAVVLIKDLTFKPIRAFQNSTYPD
jgi:hypothetical protein